MHEFGNTTFGIYFIVIFIFYIIYASSIVHADTDCFFSLFSFLFFFSSSFLMLFLVLERSYFSIIFVVVVVEKLLDSLVVTHSCCFVVLLFCSAQLHRCHPSNDHENNLKIQVGCG